MQPKTKKYKNAPIKREKDAGTKIGGFGEVKG